MGCCGGLGVYALASDAGKPEASEAHMEFFEKRKSVLRVQCGSMSSVRRATCFARKCGAQLQNVANGPSGCAHGRTCGREICVSMQRQILLWKLFKNMPFREENSPPTASATLRALHPPPFKSSTLKPTLRASHTSAPPCHNCAGTNPNFFASKNSGEAGRKWRDQAVFRLNPISVRMSGGAMGEERMMSQF